MELDIVLVDGESVADAVADLTAGLDVQHEVITHRGPGGGNPVVSFAGDDDALRELVTRYDAY